MKKAVILHGTLGSPEGNWLPWLEHQLYDRGFEVWAPALPGAEHPSLAEWLEFVRENRPFSLDGETVVIGHSSGAILALLLSQELVPASLKATVAVSVFHDNSLNWAANDRLFDVDFNWHSIKAHAGRILFVHSDNDQYVPLDQAQYVANNCQAELLVVPGGGHFNTETDAKYTEFPELLGLLEERQLL